MGSWNGTCGLSQLPIMYDDEVVIYLMKENRYSRSGVDYKGCVYPNTLYNPVAPGIIGKYKDSGQLKIKAENVNMKVIKAIYGDKVSYEDIDRIGEVIEEDSDKEGLFYMLVHKGLHDEVIKEYGGQEEFYTKGKTLAEYFEENMVEYITASRDLNDKWSFELERMRFRRELEELSLHTTYTDHNLYSDNLSDDPLIKQMIELLIFNMAMESSRKLWMPQCGNGSQSDDLKMAQVIGEFAKQKEEEDEELWG